MRLFGDDRNIPAGSVTVADGMLYVLGQDTDTVNLVEATPAGAKIVSDFPLPAIAKLRQPSGHFSHATMVEARLFTMWRTSSSISKTSKIPIRPL